jgi:hypothetical protein
LPSAIPWSLARSELEAGFARRLGQRLDAAVVAETGAVERDLSMPAALAFSAMRLPTTAAAATLPPLPATFESPARSLRTSASAVEALAEDARAVVGDDAGVDVQVGPVHGQARDALQRDAGARLLGAAQALGRSC